jgi:hypothetical protein
MTIQENVMGDAPSNINNRYPPKQMNILRDRFPAIRCTVVTYHIGGQHAHLLEEEDVNVVD